MSTIKLLLKEKGTIYKNFSIIVSMVTYGASPRMS